MSSAKPAVRAAVPLQAAVAEAALGERDLARARLDAILRIVRQQLLPLAKATADFVDRLIPFEGAAWATGTAPEPGDEPKDLDARVPQARALTLRLISAWSSSTPSAG